LGVSVAVGRGVSVGAWVGVALAVALGLGVEDAAGVGSAVASGVAFEQAVRVDARSNPISSMWKSLWIVFIMFSS
jgi:F0F1-type ATP synthase membrane subunit c/vacuolar-type H+-ATPase subunit K